MPDTPDHPWLRQTLRDHPALAFSGLYGVASLIGLVYSWLYLRPFGINVLEFSEISDFLLASLKQPLTWVLAVSAVILVELDNVMSRRVAAKGPRRWLRWYGTPTYRRFNDPVAVFLILALLWGLADREHQHIRNGGGQVYQVTLADGAAPEERVLLGTTVQFVFLYDRETGGVSIHPNENVLTLSRKPEDAELTEPSPPESATLTEDGKLEPPSEPAAEPTQ